MLKFIIYMCYIIIGIDISEFYLFENCPLRFSAWDFGGQAVYAIMQQLFMSRRAIYPLLWRVREALDVTKFDTTACCDVCGNTLVNKQPGTYIIIVNAYLIIISSNDLHYYKSSYLLIFL